MGLPTGEIQSAIVTRLRGDSTLQGLLGNPTSNPPGAVFDEGGAPVGQSFPYISVFPITTQPGTALAFDIDARDVYVQVSCYTQVTGFKQARALAKQVDALLHKQPLTLAGGFTNFLLLFDHGQELPPQKDGITEQIALRFKLMTQG